MEKLCFSVKNDSIPEEKISEYCKTYALTPEGKKAITLHLGNLKHDLSFIADDIDLPEDAESRLSELFGDWDYTKLACFIYACLHLHEIV
jgi:DNA-binding PadR family transcriptional regulator